MRKFNTKENRKASLISTVKIFLLLGLPLIMCLVVGANRNKGGGESGFERGLWHLSQQVSSFPVRNTQAGGKPIHPVRPIDGSEFKTAAHPTGVTDKPLSRFVSDDLAGMALELVDMIFRLPEKGRGAGVNADKVVVSDEKVVASAPSHNEGRLGRPSKGPFTWVGEYHSAIGPMNEVLASYGCHYVVTAVHS